MGALALIAPALAADSAVKYLANYNSILQTINAYPHGLDLKNYQATANLYTDDGCTRIPILKINTCGPANLEKAFIAADNPPGRTISALIRTQHDFSTITVEIAPDGKSVVALTYLTEFLYAQFNATGKTAASGYFNMSLVKTHDGEHNPELQWKFNETIFAPFVCPTFDVSGSQLMY